MNAVNPVPSYRGIPDPAKTFSRFAGCLLRIGVPLFILIGLLPNLWNPFGHPLQIKGMQTKCLAQAKQIAMALRLYADDHDGRFPAGFDESGHALRTSNDAFRCLFPKYTQSENLFANKLSAWQTACPDNVIDPPGEILRPGENVYSYVAGEIENKTPPSTPLIVDGTDGTGRGTYVSDSKRRGGVWSGVKVVVIHHDNSGTLEMLGGPPDARVLTWTLPDGTKQNPLSPAALGPDLKLLDPALSR